MKQKTRQFASRAAAILTIALLLLVNVPSAQAAQVTQFSDVLSRLKASTPANHEIKFVTPSGVAAGQSIIITFSAGFTNVTNIAFGDIDFAEGNSGTCSTASFTDKTLAASPSGATWGADGDSATTVTITSGTDTVTAGRCVRVRIGTNATVGTAGTNQISNGAIGSSDTISLSGTFGDTGTAAIEIITDDQVAVTATVDPTIAFTISDNTVGFGTLSTATGRWANGAATGGNATASNTPTSAHQMTVATNAQSGYAITYFGPTLTAAGPTISVATISGDSDGTPGSEQFALSLSTSGNATIASGYARGTNSDWNYVASTTTTIVSETGPTDTETLDVSYLANIAGSTEAGAYSTAITYVATGTF